MQIKVSYIYITQTVLTKLAKTDWMIWTLIFATTLKNETALKNGSSAKKLDHVIESLNLQFSIFYIFFFLHIYSSWNHKIKHIRPWYHQQRLGLQNRGHSGQVFIFITQQMFDTAHICNCVEGS